MVPCNYWNTNAVATIAENGIKLYRVLSNRNETLDCLKKIVNIYEAEISVNLLNASSREVLLSASRQCISVLEDITINNSERTGFLLWFGNYCISCISRATRRSKYMYSMMKVRSLQCNLFKV